MVAGYPERLQQHEVSTHVGDGSHGPSRVGANSAVLYSPSGECMLDYRKTNLFETDVTWAKPGTSSFSPTI